MELPNDGARGRHLAGQCAARLGACRGPGPPAHREDVYFRTADFFGGAGFFRGAAFRVGGLRASLTALPAWNRTALLAGISMVSPVRGFRPSRGGRPPTLKMPRPVPRTPPPSNSPPS